MAVRSLERLIDRCQQQCCHDFNIRDWPRLIYQRLKRKASLNFSLCNFIIVKQILITLDRSEYLTLSLSPFNPSFILF